MSRATKEINKVTGTVIGLAVRMIFYAVVLILLVEGCSKGYSFGHEIFCSTAMEAAPGKDHTVTILRGTSDREVGELLKKEKLIKSPLILQIQAKFYDYTIQPGTYTLNTSMTTKDILWTLDQGTGEEDQIPTLEDDSEKDSPSPELDITTAQENDLKETEALQNESKESQAEIEITID